MKQDLCKSPGATFAISETLQKFWQGDGDEASGIEFSKIQWSRGHMPHIFNALGVTQIGADKLKVRLQTFPSVSGVKLMVTLYDKNGNSQVLPSSSSFVCK